MLCNIVEGGKVRCYNYLGEGEREIMDAVGETVEISKVRMGSGGIYTHIFYSGWPDRGVPG